MKMNWFPLGYLTKSKMLSILAALASPLFHSCNQSFQKNTADPNPPVNIEITEMILATENVDMPLMP